jgi:anhydro-N-acetylmuramic acid kinase
VSELYIGLMSGTSLDGVDGVLIAFDADGVAFTVRGHAHRAYPAELARELLTLNQPGGADELHRGALAANAVARAYAEVVAALLLASGTAPQDVRAVGAHGQTVRHRPGAVDGTGYTVQLLNAALLAERCGIAVAADFRSRDVAAGGQGAPLVPAFHRHRFGRAGETVAVLNLGGIGNLTVVGPDGATIGLDTGPGNLLMDGWVGRHRGTTFDADGAWAASGTPDPALLEALRAEPFFALPPPKSTGRDLFGLAWLDAAFVRAGTSTGALDVQATLAELTASTAADAIRVHAAGAKELVVCGGGARNGHLLRRLAALLPGVDVVTSDNLGLPCDQVEACAFAWLARALVHRQPGNLAAVTGAAGPRVLGALYPA